MPSGGSRPGAGRPRDPMALRTDRRVDPNSRDGWTLLPKSREGDPPPWPLSGQSEREMDLWASFWRKPQAVIWEKSSLVEVVALFVRQFVEGEVPKSSAENRKTIRLMMADLYLTPESMAKAHLYIAEDELEPKRDGKQPERKSAKSRLRVVDGSGA